MHPGAKSHPLVSAGVRIVNEQFRGGEKVREAFVDVWDSTAYTLPSIQQAPYEIIPGDHFRTTCYYDDKKGKTNFGVGANKEMCIAFLMYYPRRVLPNGSNWFCGPGERSVPACRSSHTTENLSLSAELGRVFGPPLHNAQGCFD